MPALGVPTTTTTTTTTTRYIGHVAYALILLMDLVHYAIVPKSNPDHHVDLRILIECRYGIVVSSS